MRSSAILAALVVALAAVACGSSDSLSPVKSDTTIPDGKDFKFKGEGGDEKGESAHVEFEASGVRPSRLRRMGETRFTFSAGQKLQILRVVLDIDAGETGTFRTVDTPQLTLGSAQTSTPYESTDPVKVTLQKNSDRHCKGALKGTFERLGRGNELPEPIRVEGRFDYRSEDHQRRDR